MRDRNQPGFIGQHPFKFDKREFTLQINRRNFKNGAGLLAQKLPRHNIGMMLHARDHYLVAGLDIGSAEGLRN